MFDIHEGYKQAHRIDAILDEVLQAHEITNAENIYGYLAFLRTAETGLRIARRELKATHALG